MRMEKIMRQAAVELRQAALEGLPEPEECNYTFSPRFEENMKPIFALARRQQARARRRRRLQRVAGFFLVLLLSSTAFLGVNAQAREAFFGWVSQRLGSEQHYFFEGSEQAAPETVSYYLPEIPEGYTEYDVYQDGNFYSRSYANAGGKLLTLEYSIGNSGEIFLGTTDTEKKTVYVHGKPAEFYRATSSSVSSTIVWQDEETKTMLFLSGFFEEKDLIQLAESIKKD